MKEVFQDLACSKQLAVGRIQSVVCSGRFSSVYSLIIKALKVLLPARCLLIYCLLLSCQLSNAQIYPVQATPQIIPPYSFKLSDYTTTTQEKLFVNLLLTDAQESGRQVRLKLFVEGPGINFQSVDFVSGALPIVLDGGINLRLTNLDLQPYFNLNNLVGISPQQYSQQLPEGQYRFCFEVYDQFSGQRISNRSCANIYLVLNDPPLLNVPFRGDLVTAQNLQNIIFNWTPRHINAGAVQYEFTLKELWDTGMDPQAAFLASPPLYQATTFANTLHYGPAQTPLLEGKTYGWQVRAFVSDGFSDTSLFRNNGNSEIYHFTYRADCPPPRFVLSEAQNSQTVTINWQMGEQLRYRVQYRKKGYGADDWFGQWSQSNEATIRNLEAGTVYEFRVGGECTPNGGLAYSPIHEFTTPTEDEMAYYNCGIPPEIEIENQNPLQNLGVNEVFTAGDFPVVVREVTGSNGYFTGWGYITLPFLEQFKEVIDAANIATGGEVNIGKFSRIRVEFENIKINTDYQLVEGMVETSYDANWSNVGSVDEFIEDIGQLVGSIKEIISQIFDRREEELNKLQELQNQLEEGSITEEEFNEQAEEKANNIEKLDDLLGEQLKEKILESPAVTEAQKEEVKNLGPTALANNDDLSQADIDNIKTKDTATRKRLEEIAEEVALAEDMYFVNEAYTLLAEDGVYQEVLEKIKTISEYLKESTELCREQGWGSYRNQGVFPYCLWKEAPIAEAFYYSKVDIPFVAGLTDGLYGELEGLVLLPKMFYDLSTGMQEFIYAYTWAKWQCTANKVAMNQKRMGLLLEKLEKEQAETSIWNWVKEQWYAEQKELTEYKNKRCEDAEKLRTEVDEFVGFIQERENLKQLIADVEEKLADYLNTISETDNEARYHHGKIFIVVASSLVPVAGWVSKSNKVKKILQAMRNFTKGQWDEFFEEVGQRLGRNGNLFSKFGQKLDEIGEVLENGLVKGKYSGRVFNPNNAGGAIKSLNWENAIIKKENIEIVKKHLGRLESDPWNDAMIKRLEDIEGGKIVPTDYDKKFITHEIGEFERYKELGYENTHYSQIPEEVWNNAHSATLEDYSISDYIIKPDGMRDFQLYHPDVQQIPE